VCCLKGFDVYSKIFTPPAAAKIPVAEASDSPVQVKPVATVKEQAVLAAATASSTPKTDLSSKKEAGDAEEKTDSGWVVI
jgi:hypothetical protein